MNRVHVRPAAVDSAGFRLEPGGHVTGHLRNWVCGSLRRWGLEPLTPDLELIATELAGNALLHGELPARATLELLPARGVRLAVTDAGPGFLPEPVVASWEDDADGAGRGLMIVSALSTAWGVDRLDLGQRVWADLVPH
ncbi:ATP-binding protein [Kitasatospora sp. NPDC048365]|uniref:ATP-binding protein n=1 Tax=Kitasatospora sp. NPDC048365 TaxID=3364050 RepID=UPI0037131D21